MAPLGVPGADLVVWRDKGFDDGDIPGCHSALGVCHLNGNAAEHMNLLLSDERVASGDGATLDQTEMKGSGLILDSCRAHEEWWRACRHVSRVMGRRATRTDHLSFDCCETLARVD